MTIRVVLADDHAVLRDSLRAFLGLYPDIEVVGEAADGVETLERVDALRPDVLVLDMAMPRLSGLDVLQRITKDLPECKTLVLSQHETRQYVLPALKAGAKGYLLKRAGGREVVQAVRALAGGESYLHPAVANYVIDAAFQKDAPLDAGSGVNPLTLRQKEVLSLITEGLTNAEIARALSISPKTVDKHRAAIMDKLGIHTRAGLMRYAIDRN